MRKISGKLAENYVQLELTLCPALAVFVTLVFLCALHLSASHLGVVPRACKKGGFCRCENKVANCQTLMNKSLRLSNRFLIIDRPLVRISLFVDAIHVAQSMSSHFKDNDIFVWFHCVAKPSTLRLTPTQLRGTAPSLGKCIVGATSPLLELID